MAGTVTTVKTASWGVTTPLGFAAVSGVITDYEESSEPTLQPEHNEMGSVINQTMNDKHHSVNLTIQVKADTDKPEEGSQISIGDGEGAKTYYVTSARITESNSAYRKIAISAEAYHLCNATEACAGIAPES